MKKGGQNEYLEEKKKVGQKAENDPSKETNQTTKNSEKFKGSKFARPKKGRKLEQTVNACLTGLIPQKKA